MIFSESPELNDYLNRDERLIWTGQPKKGLIFRKTDIFVVPFSLLWCGFAIFWMSQAGKAGGIFSLFGIPFVVVGLYFVFGRFIVDMKIRAKTFYGLTEDRIIIRSGIFTRSTNSINLKSLTNLEFTEKNDGSGTIILGPRNPYDPYGMANGMHWPGMKTSTPCLDQIEDVRKVYSLIVQQKG